MKKEKPTYKNIEYDSQEEIWFILWLEEAAKHNFIHDYIYHPNEYELSPKVYNDQNKMILRQHTYSPDFEVIFRPEFWLKYPLNPLIYYAEKTITSGGEHFTVRQALIDVKGKYARMRGKFPATSGLTFPINQKWMYQKYGIFINAIQPSSTTKDDTVTKKGFFAHTFVPTALAFNRNTKAIVKRKEFSDCRLLNEDPTIF